MSFRDIRMTSGRTSLARMLLKGPCVAHTLKWFDASYDLLVKREIVRVWREHEDAPRMVELTEKGRQWAASHGVK